MEIKPFHAAVYMDEKYQRKLPRFWIDTTSHEALLESVDAVRSSSHAPEVINGALSVIKARANTLFSEDEIASLFQGVEESDGTPQYVIPINGKNYPRIYEALDEAAANVPEEFPAEAVILPDNLLQEVKDLTAEVERLQVADETVVPFQNLPLASEETLWDEGEARAAVKAWAGESVLKYRTAFCWYDAEKEDTSLLLATLENDSLVVVPSAVARAATRLESVPEEDKLGVKFHLEKYYKQMGKEIPWSEKAAETDDEKVTSLESAIVEKDKTISSLRSELAKFEELKYKELVTEAAALAIERNRAITKGKTPEEVYAVLVERSEESLNDMIADMRLEAPEVTVEVEKVSNPTLPAPIEEQIRDHATSPETTVGEELHQTIEENDDSTVVYRQFLPKDVYDKIKGGKE